MTMLPDIDEQTYVDDQQKEFQKRAQEQQGAFSFMQNAQAQIAQLQSLVGGAAANAGQAVQGAASGAQDQMAQLQASVQQGVQGAQQAAAEAPQAMAQGAQDQLSQLQQSIGAGVQQAQAAPQAAADQMSQLQQSISGGIGQAAQAAQQAVAPAAAAGGDLRDYARAAAQKAGIDPDIFVAQIQQESGFNPSAKSPAGALGIAQFMPGTAQGMGVDPSDPYAALDAAARLDAQNLKKYGGYDSALAAYNAGGGAVDKYGGVPPFEETQRYVKNILGSAGQAIGGAASALGTKAQQTYQDISQFGNPELTSDEAYSACGPAAAVRFAQRFGRNPTLREAVDIAKEVGWSAAQGMAGIASEQQLLNKLGI